MRARLGCARQGRYAQAQHPAEVGNTGARQVQVDIESGELHQVGERAFGLDA